MQKILDFTFEIVYNIYLCSYDLCERGVLMAVYAMSDLHLALSADKPMDVFGGRWSDYMQRICVNWNSIVGNDDTVLIGGDVSWAMYLAQCDADFDFINRLNGSKIISKGNHDYWWESITKMNAYLEKKGFDTISFLHNNSYIAENYAICGTRGWTIPSSDSFAAADAKMYERELARLALSADAMENKICANGGDFEKIAVLHYPPVTSDGVLDDGVGAILKKHGVTKCIYGHLHGAACANAFCGETDGIKFRLVSSDYMNFEPCNLNF